MKEISIPEGLLKRWRLIFGEELEQFLEAIRRPLKPSVRVNTLKISVRDFLELMKSRELLLMPVPWCKWGFWVEGTEEESLGNMWEHFAGLMYIQEASSMIPVEVLQPQPGMKVLDMAAAPGSKTTQMAQWMENTGVIVANDVNAKRLKALTNNLERLGVLNVCVTQTDGRRFGRLMPGTFDMILVDAPCSAEGTIRKSYKAVLNWQPWGYKKLSETQKMLLVSAYKALKPGGVLVYSTCTFAPEENEGVVSYLLENYDVETVPVEVQGLNVSPPVEEWEGVSYHPMVANCVRVYPHKNEVGGFFVAKMVKR